MCDRILVHTRYFIGFIRCSILFRAQDPAREPETASSKESAFSAQVGEWLKPADCKSAPPCEVRRFESSPVHHFDAFSGREQSRCKLGSELAQ